MEMYLAPASAYARAVSLVMPPDASIATSGPARFTHPAIRSGG